MNQLRYIDGRATYWREDLVRAASASDATPQRTGYGESACSLCFLGYSHTEAAHDQSKAAYLAAS